MAPLHAAAQGNHLEVMKVLIEAGAKINSRMSDGATPLFCAARDGRPDAIKVLLHAKADPLLTAASPSGITAVPLDVAAKNGYLEAVRELIHQLGIEGCAGASGGADALKLAAHGSHVDIMATLVDAGVVDTGAALHSAARVGHTKAVRFLLQQREDKPRVGGVSYANAKDPCGRTALVQAIVFGGYTAARVARLLVDAEADTTSTVRIRTDPQGSVFFRGTPLTLTAHYLHALQIAGGAEATQEQLGWLEAVRRLLLQVEAVRAVSWLWPSDSRSVVPAAAEGARRSTTTSDQLASMLPILRQRARRPQVFLGALRRLVMGMMLVYAVMALAAFVEGTRV